MTAEIPVTQARADLSDLVSRAAFGNERISLTRHGRVIAALVSAADLERLIELDEQPRRLGPPRIDPVPNPTLPAEPRRFGIAAEHRELGPGRGAPVGDRLPDSGGSGGSGNRSRHRYY
ncbi:MAG: type II toxin-antitoxin system Phd/YefM family antitoxin [Frankia sp.]